MFDLIGTTVVETQPDVIAACFNKAFHVHGIAVTTQFINSNRGKSKVEVINAAISAASKELNAQTVLATFEKLVEQNLGSFKAANGTFNTFEILKKQNVFLGIGSGMPRELFLKVVRQVQFPIHLFDFTGSAEDAGGGRPDPTMIQAMLSKLGLSPNELIKVGDTVADVEEGKNAGVATVAILSGTQDEETLRKANPDFVIKSMEEIPQLVFA